MNTTGTPTTLRSTRREQFEALRDLKPLVYDALASKVQCKKMTRDDARVMYDRFEDAVKTLEMMADLAEVEL